MDKSLDRTHLRLRPTADLVELASTLHPASNCFGELAVVMGERLTEYAVAVVEARNIISKSPGRAAAILQQLK